MSGPFGSSQWMYSSGGFYPTEIEQSLRFNDDDSAYLSWTPASAGNRKTFTISAWVKRSKLGSYQGILSAQSSGSAGTPWTALMFTDGDNLRFSHEILNSSGVFNLTTTQVFRDTSAWYHIVIEVDTTQATASDRVKFYVNGEQITSFGTSTYPSQNYDTSINNSVSHYLGKYIFLSSDLLFDGYLAEVNFIDGQALDPTDFGELKSGVWVAKEYAGSYGTNGFYLPFKQTTVANGFNAVTYDTSNVSYPKPVTGVGFQPDLVWIKSRTQAYNHYLFDSVRGAGVTHLNSNTTGAEGNDGVAALDSFDSDGFTIGAGAGLGVTSAVAWCWDAGSGSPASNTDGSITSSVKSNPAYGFSVITWTGNDTAGATIGHGLNSAPEMFITFRRNVGDNHPVYHSALGNTKAVHINLTDTPYTGSGYWNDTSPTSSVISLGNDSSVNWSAYNYVGYAFHSVSGYSSISSYSGTGASGNTITTGFPVAFVMVKRTDSTSNWTIFDNTRDAFYDGSSNRLFANSSDVENTAANYMEFTDTGFILKAGDGAINASGGTYIYMAFADTRDAAFWRDLSGNDNTWQPNALQNSDVMLDSPTNNWAVLNPLSNSGGTYTEGNLQYAGPSSWRKIQGTTGVSTGKWYWEVAVLNAPEPPRSSTSTYNGFGFTLADTTFKTSNPQTDSEVLLLGDNGYYRNFTGSWTDSGSTIVSGDILGCAVDLDAGTFAFKKNNVDIATGSIDSSADGKVLTPQRFSYNSSYGKMFCNFGQDSSFAGNKTPQGNTDDNGVGDFYYAPPSGYLALCTANLPDPVIDPAQDDVPSDYFNTVLFNGNGGSNSVTGLTFQPDFVWVKSRSNAYSHNLHDVIRGTSSYLQSNDTDAENTTYTDICVFDADGFTLSSASSANISGTTNVGWSWLAGNGTSSNTDGSITSTVSVSQKAGFSVTAYTAAGATATVGHGLSAEPSMIIIKNRTAPSGYNWNVYHKSIGNTQRVFLDSTSAAISGVWNNTSPTSSVFTIGGNAVYDSGDYIAYCFAEVEGYSKFGSYTGNGSTDGPFVYCGFRPAFVMVKPTSRTGRWRIKDTTRDVFNVMERRLDASSTDAEATGSTEYIDFTSNGFKIRTSEGQFNGSGETNIYMAFAENPFKYANAR